MPCTKCTAITSIIENWLNQQGHNRCWYYPELFRKLADIHNLTSTVNPTLPPLEEFRRGCTRYQAEEYDLSEKISQIPTDISSNQVPHEEIEQQTDKEAAVLLALQHGQALIRRELAIYGMKKDATIERISQSISYEDLWRDALTALRNRYHDDSV